jgi:hypothetical protein
MASSTNKQPWLTPSTTPHVPRILQDEFFRRGLLRQYLAQQTAMREVPALCMAIDTKNAHLTHVKTSGQADASEGLFVRDDCRLPRDAIIGHHQLVKCNDAAKLDAPDIQYSFDKSTRMVTGSTFHLASSIRAMEAYRKKSQAGANVDTRWFPCGSRHTCNWAFAQANVPAKTELLRSYGAAYWMYRTLKIPLFCYEKMSDMAPQLRFPSLEADQQARTNFILACWLLVYHHLMTDGSPESWFQVYSLLVDEMELDAVHMPPGHKTRRARMLASAAALRVQ